MNGTFTTPFGTQYGATGEGFQYNPSVMGIRGYPAGDNPRTGKPGLSIWGVDILFITEPHPLPRATPP